MIEIPISIKMTAMFAKINHGFITFNRGSSAELVLLPVDFKINQS